MTDGFVDWSTVEEFIEGIGFNPILVKNLTIHRGYIQIEHFVQTSENAVLATQDGKYISYTILLEAM